MTSPLPRRSLLRGGVAGGLGIVVAGSLEAIAGPAAARPACRPAVGYGDLVPDPAGLLALPPGFSYTVVAQAGATLLESGQPTPSDADGTGCFRGPRGSVLVNNHEIGGDEPYPVPALPGRTRLPSGAELRKVWPDKDNTWKRTILASVIERIEVSRHPGRCGQQPHTAPGRGSRGVNSAARPAPTPAPTSASATI
ncbi:alkaline phosphatase PhoX [Micromonospora sp. NPDC005223]|uniref:alkaline phosphatase PhoX n=1 Tax=Micromonospora sp. NPDC005223 TaxID=3364227 RepID=UPI00368B996F